MAVGVLLRAHELNLNPYGISFHVGSQQTRLEAWDSALGEAKAIFDAMQKHGIVLLMVISAAASDPATAPGAGDRQLCQCDS